MRVADIRQQFIELYRLQRTHDNIEVNGTLEILGASFTATEPSIFGQPNADYIARELEWYRSESLYVDDIPGKTPKIWENVAARDGTILSNYGWMLFSEENGSQYTRVLEHLEREPEGRRAVAVYTRPTVHDEWNANGRRDFICTHAVNYMIRNNYLYAVVQMRSNDVRFGYPNDLAWQQWVLDGLAEDTGTVPGDITWQAASLHIYRRDYDLIRKHIEHHEGPSY
jgi:thymidylate synthase